MLTVCTWLWGEKYGPEYVLRLKRGVNAHLKQPHRFVCITDYPRGDVEAISQRWTMPEWSRKLINVKGCFARLALFDPYWQELNSVGERIVCLDLDAIVAGELDVLFNRPESFVILQGANSANPCPYNGSVFMLRAGAHRKVFQDFSLDAVSKIKFYEFPDDQGWLWEKIPNAAGWKAGPQSGIYAFQKPGWPKGEDLPTDARIVAFPGWRDPSRFTHLEWVKQNWVAA